MIIENDLSLSTLIIGAIIAGVGWGLKETAKTLISTLIKTMAKVEMLDNKFSELLKTLASYPKMQHDLNELYGRVKKMEEKLS